MAKLFRNGFLYTLRQMFYLPDETDGKTDGNTCKIHAVLYNRRTPERHRVYLRNFLNLNLTFLHKKLITEPQ